MIKQLQFAILGMAVAAVSWCSTATAQTPTLSFGTNNTITLLEDTANQTVDIFALNVANMDFEGFTLWMKIGDGGTAIGGTDTGPAIFTAVDLFPTGTIFDSESQTDIASSPLAWGKSQDQISADGSNGITRDGLVGQVTFSTVGIGSAGDTAAFDLMDVSGNSTFFNTGGQNPLRTTPDGLLGTINIVAEAVPEPSSLLVLAGLTTVGLIRRRR